MAHELPDRNAKALSPGIDLPLMAALAALPLVLLVRHVPAQLLLPGIAALAFVAAAAMTAIGWMLRAEPRANAVTVFDCAGACLLIGIAAAAFSAPHHVAEFFGVAIAAP